MKFFNVALSLIILYTGISLSNESEWIHYTSGDYVRSIAEEDEFLWIGTDGGGLVRFHKSSGETTIYDKTNSGLPSNFVNALAVDAEGVKWIGTDKGVVRYDGDQWRVYNSNNSGLPYENVNALTTDNEGVLWVCS